MTLKPWSERSATRKALDQLDGAVHYLLACVEAPRLQGPKGVQWYQFPQQTALELIIVKAARAVSALNAIPVLIETGYTQEAAVLLRTVDDFLDETSFMIDASQRDQMTQGQKAFIRAFFSEAVEPTEELLRNLKGRDRTKRTEIRAAQARLIGGDNPHRTQQLVQALDKGLDGYVHGGYPQSMELYLGGGRFALNGAMVPAYMDSRWYHYAHYISRTFSVLGLVVLATNNEKYKEELVAMRNVFEASSDWPDDA